jgi:hypothetical protein
MMWVGGLRCKAGHQGLLAMESLTLLQSPSQGVSSFMFTAGKCIWQAHTRGTDGGAWQQGAAAWREVVVLSAGAD